MLRSTLLALGLAATTALAVPVNQTLTPPQVLEAAAKAAVTCSSGIYMIAARGSGEDPGEGPLSMVTSMVKALVPGSTSVAVDYPAVIFDDTSLYPLSVTEGINDAIAKIKAYVAACGSGSRIVLLGFSQGGNVMTDVLAGGVLKPAPIPESYRQNIRAIVSFGDPTFTAGQSFDVGTATKNGIFSRGGDSLAKLSTYGSVLRMYCQLHDTVCATGDSLNVHSAEVASHAAAAAEFIVSLA